MDLQKIGKEYPNRVLDRLSINHVSIDLLFDLPRKRHLHLTISIFPCKGVSLLETSVHVIVNTPSKYERIEASRFKFAGEEKDIPRYLQDYLFLCIGDLEKHTYEDGMILHLLQQLEHDKK